MGAPWQCRREVTDDHTLVGCSLTWLIRIAKRATHSVSRMKHRPPSFNMRRILHYGLEFCFFLLFIRMTHANDLHQVNTTEKCADSLTLDNKCSIVNNTQEPTSVLRKCCQRGLSYDSKKRTCLQKNETGEFDTSDFDFLSRNATGFDGIVFGMPNCSKSQVLIDFTLISDSLKDISSDEFKAERFCVDTDFENDSQVARRCVDAKKSCGKIPCVRKCCPPGKNMMSRLCSKTDSTRGFNITFHDTKGDTSNVSTKIELDLDYGIYHGSVCEIGKYPLDPKKDASDTFYIAENGSVMHPRLNRYYSTEEYCLEDVYIPKRMDGVIAFICFEKEKQTPVAKWDITYNLIAFGLILSCVFLLATFLVYLFLPALQNIHGMTLMCHVASFLVAFICLATVQIGFVNLSKHVCTALAFVMLFAFLASFAWMNIMCFDIWWTFGGVRSVNHSSRKQQIRKKFAWYSLYAWGIPIVITASAIALEFAGGPAIIKPNMGTKTCWFPNDQMYGKLVVFIIPLALLIACNVVLFVLTARNCSKVKSEINRMQKSTDDRSKKKFQADKEKLMMNGKLFIVMGVSWTIEVISLAVPEKQLPQFWTYIPDTFNALQGVAIFAIFVLKGKVLNALADRLGFKKKRKDESSTQNNSASEKQVRVPYCQNRKSSSSSTCITTATSVGSCDRSSAGRVSS